VSVILKCDGQGCKKPATTVLTTGVPTTRLVALCDLCREVEQNVPRSFSEYTVADYLKVSGIKRDA
jgi:hypothetical protein